MNSMNKYLLISFFTLVCSGCTQVDDKPDDIISATIIGSAEYPDPVLVRVNELAKQGIISDVKVMESFPVQVRLTGPFDVIKELELIPRKTNAL